MVLHWIALSKKRLCNSKSPLAKIYGAKHLLILASGLFSARSFSPRTMKPAGLACGLKAREKRASYKRKAYEACGLKAREKVFSLAHFAGGFSLAHLRAYGLKSAQEKRFFLLRT